MKPELTYEQCKALKELGLSQEKTTGIGWLCGNPCFTGDVINRIPCDYCAYHPSWNDLDKFCEQKGWTHGGGLRRSDGWMHTVKASNPPGAGSVGGDLHCHTKLQAFAAAILLYAGLLKQKPVEAKPLKMEKPKKTWTPKPGDRVTSARWDSAEMQKSVKGQTGTVTGAGGDMGSVVYARFPDGKVWHFLSQELVKAPKKPKHVLAIGDTVRVKTEIDKSKYVSIFWNPQMDTCPGLIGKIDIKTPEGAFHVAGVGLGWTFLAGDLEYINPNKKLYTQAEYDKAISDAVAGETARMKKVYAEYLSGADKLK